MKKNKYVITIALLLIAVVIFTGRGVNNPITVADDNPLIVYEGAEDAYASVKSVLTDGDKDFKVKVGKLPSENPVDYVMAYTNVHLKINTFRKVLVGGEIASESEKYQDRIIMIPSFDGKLKEVNTYDETNIVIYIGGLSKKEVKELKEDIGVMLTYKVGAYKEKSMFLSPGEYGYEG